MPPLGDHDETLVPVLLGMARGAYAEGIRLHLAGAGIEGVPRSGSYVLGGMGNQRGTAADLVQDLGITKQAASQLIDTLVTRGFLERHTSPGDRRRVSIELTERGRVAARAIGAGVADVDRRLGRVLSPQEMAGMRAGLLALSRVKHELEAEGQALKMAPPATSPEPPSPPLLAELSRRVFERSGTSSLGLHLESVYGVKVKTVTQLDVGVLRVELEGGAGWAVRLYPAQRARQWAEGDREVLAYLAAEDFPSERPATDNPVSVHEGQAVLVTEDVGNVPRSSRRDAIRGLGGHQALGEMLGRLQVMAKPKGLAGRRGGAWHHLVDGGPSDELEAATKAWQAAHSLVPPGQGHHYQALGAALEACDDAHGLPQALVHPDFVLANVVASPQRGLVVVDWTGAGWGPRLWSLAFLLWSAGAQELGRVDRVIDGYRRYVRLGPQELARLADVVRARPTVLATWGFCLGRTPLAEAAREVANVGELAAAISARVATALAP